MTVTAEAAGTLEIGDIDLMSHLRDLYLLPACDWPLPSGAKCTRAAGHDETADTGLRGGRVSPATAMHVHADRFGITHEMSRS